MTKKKKEELKPPLEILAELKDSLIKYNIPNVILNVEDLEKSLMEQKELLDDVRLAIAKFLEKQGWSVVLVADHGVKPGTDKFKYEYYCKFLGSQVKKEGEPQT